ncbi:MAG: nucleoside deaminase [Pontibacterium sp.]
MDKHNFYSRYQNLPVDLSHREEQAGRRCCQLAIEAIGHRSYGVGAVLLDAEGAILAEAYNRVFDGAFQPAAHAEMETLDTFEARYPDYGDRSELTLVVSLEPCPMCLCRILLTGIGRVRYLCADPEGGMAHRIYHLPAAWRDLSSLVHISEADVSPELRSFAADLAKYDQSDHRKWLITQIRG